MARRSVGAAAAEGIESGFRMGVQAEELGLRKKADARAEEDQTAQRLRDQNAERRLGVRDNLDLMDRRMKLVGDRQQEIVGLSTAAQTAGQPVDPALAKEYGSNAEELTRMRQTALDFFSRAQTGQIDPLSAPPAELYTNLVAATGRPLTELREVPKYVKDVQAGLETGNDGLLVQGVNGLLAPQLRRGIGTASPHGGKIVRKEIIGMDPAVDNNGTPLPGKFMPRLRVYVEMPGMNGGNLPYYDAPMTVDGSGDNDDRVAVIDVANAMQWMGNLGTLATAIQRPDIAAALDAGEKEAGAKTKAYLDRLTAISRPKRSGVVNERLETVRSYAKEKGITDEQAAETLQRMGVMPSLTGLAAKNATIDELPATDDEKARLRRDVALGAGGKTTGLIPQKPGKGKGAVEPEGLSKEYTSDPAYAQQVDFWADVLAKGGTLPPRFAQSGAGKKMFSDIVQRVPALGGSANDMMSNQSEFGGLKAGARAVGTRAANFGLAKEEAYEMADLVTETSGRVNRTSFAPINRALNAFSTNTGNAEIREFGAALNSFINAYARAVSPVGTPTVSDKDHAREMLSTADSHEQVQAIIKQLKREMEAAGRAPKTVRQQQRDAAQELRSGGDSAKPKYVEGQTATGPGGKKLVFKGGSWQQVQ